MPMRKNIYIKSMGRQPLRTLLLMLLIATASFTFVMRTTEYILIRNQISEMSLFFHTVGTLSHRDGVAADVSAAIDIIAESPFVSSYDRRRGFEGTLVDMKNAYLDGSRYWRAAWAYRYLQDDFFGREYITFLPRLTTPPEFAGFVSGDSYFYGELLGYTHTYTLPAWGVDPWGFYPNKILYVEVDTVLHGYPERVREGQLVGLRMDFPGEWDSPLTEMEVGQRYFFYGTFYFMLGRLQRDSSSPIKYIRQLGDSGLWYVPVAPGETIDTEALGLCRPLEMSRHAQSAVYLRTTRDMTVMPAALECRNLIRLRDGRFLDEEDYAYARPVVVIQERFAQIRQVSVGDTITVRVNADQHLVHSPYYLTGTICEMNPVSERIAAFPELGVLSVPGAYPEITLELEVVGIFSLFHLPQVWTGWSSLNKFMYIPDSLIPADWGLQSAHFGEIGPDYTPALWYSFSLYNLRDQDAFLWHTRETLEDLGFRVNFIGRDGSEFWATADTILLSTTLNFVMFSIVLVLVTAIAAALFLWQRNRDYAILRSLGCSVRGIALQATAALIVFSLPAVLIGSVAGWFYAIEITRDKIAGFAEIIASHAGTHLVPSQREALIASYTEAILPSMGWIIALSAIVLAAMLFFLVIGSLRAARISVLETLQGAR